ncbi:LEM-3-like GIY-YIG domain-containing protein [Schaedlerella arabinosiphila]|uniref:LEM-3-like GIY-YIG domain-containing protein n=1 Tax=Schaedlerella arabinosiphila TaxID=2044587 RepID=UPI0025582214|nr:hypothetical protein [Schaedlerella arabinosiphila]
MEYITGFSELTLQKINQAGEYYVYGLIDPRNDRLFYIGKGTGNRVFHHVVESSKNPESEKEKLQTINSIEASGQHVKHILINWGLSEAEAFASEASLINLMNYISDIHLSNIVAGHHTNGCLSVEEIEKVYGAELLNIDEIIHKILVIKVNKLYNHHMSSKEVYDVVRGVWRANISKVKQVEYVLGVYNNLIVACYKPDRWYTVSDIDIEKLPQHINKDDLDNIQRRVLFECDNITSLDENQIFYLNKSIEQLGYIQKSQNPIIYINI